MAFRRAAPEFIATPFILEESMPDLRILTWNSTGENASKAAELAAEINGLNTVFPATPVLLVLNQEAQNQAGGAIYTMLDDPGAGGVGANYTRPPEHITEMPKGGGAGYTMLPGTALAINAPLAVYDYTADPVFTHWVNGLSPQQRQTAWNEVAAWRPPAAAQFTCAGQAVRLITWHAPLGLSGLLIGCTTQGGAPLDAFLFLEQSSLLRNTAGVDIVIIAGDLNLTATDLATSCQGYEPLDDFVGQTSGGTGLDHILAWLPNGGGPPQFLEPVSTLSSSVHDLFSCRVSW